MKFEIFDEEYYLKSYPFLQPAIEQNIIQSGLDHFQRFGLALGFTEISRSYDEAFYLGNNPGITEAINGGIFPSGVAHFIQFGYEEGRTFISSDYNEQFYRTVNPDLEPFIQNGTFRNGLEHFIKFGANEGRYGSSFLEPEYLANNPGVAAAVEAGAFRTGREHYEQFGQFEPLRSATFVGTRETDIVQGFGIGNVEIIGVEVGFDTNGNRIYESNGFNGSLEASENDVLVGTPGSDTFVIGVGRSITDSPPGDFYPWFSGTARIRNFNPDQDAIQLGGTQASGYIRQDDGFDLTILNGARIPLAIIEGGSGISNLNVIYSGEIPLERNFLEDEYLSQNPDVAEDVAAGIYRSGLDHYERVGQFDPNRSATFVGSSGNDTVTAFGVGSHDITGVEVVSSGTSRSYTSTGTDEFDTLVGSPGAADNFILGDVTLIGRTLMPRIQTFYRGNGNATLVNFNQADGDSIEMVIGSQENYTTFSSGSDLAIAVDGDILAVIAGGAGLTLTPTDVNNNPFYQSFTLI